MEPSWIGEHMGERLQDKHAIVTGAGRGIGAAIAERFAAEGARVVVAEKNALTGQQTATAIQDAGGKALFLETDVTKVDSVNAMVARATEAFGPVDVLVNNAGENVFHDPLEMPEEAWDQCMDLDLKAFWYCARAVLPSMRTNGRGSVINIASIHSHQIIRGTFPYPVAKHAVIGLTRSLALEYAHENIRVNAIAPGYVETQLAVEYWQTFPDPEAAKAEAYRVHPPGRICRPEEVAYAAVFLGSDEAPFINAETLVMDGGRTALYHD
jgi:NAD(P)-dependent dehydrogenase (short-subunit alcohol dehydrogenase family)